jgi:16S rRNA pseudouridine516 synthase
MFEAVNSQVHYLKRIKFATLTLDETLPLGAYRPLNNEEINNLKA